MSALRRLLRLAHILGLLAVSLFVLEARAGETALHVEEPWVRATVASQETTGVYMRLTSRKALTLTGVRSPVAKQAKIHVSEIEDSIMKMRAIHNLPLSAGETAIFHPGGLHIMLLGLKQPIKVGQHVPIVLLFTDAHGVQREQKLEAEVHALKTDPQSHRHD